jgi:hypothetical protein
MAPLLLSDESMTLGALWRALSGASVGLLAFGF